MFNSETALLQKFPGDSDLNDLKGVEFDRSYLRDDADVLYADVEEQSRELKQVEDVKSDVGRVTRVESVEGLYE